MLDKIEEKNDNINILKNSCFSLTPLQKNNCNFCSTNIKEKKNTNTNININMNTNTNNNTNINSNYINSGNNVFFNKYVLDIHSQRKHFEGK
jgi:hypothetical protein